MPRPPKPNPLVSSALDTLDEMRLFPDDEARKRAVEEHIRSSSRGWNLAIGSAVLAGAGVGAHFLLKHLLPAILPTSLPPVAGSLIHLAGVVAVYLIVLRALHRWGAALEMRRRLLRAGVPVCLKCGYLLRGLAPDTPRCPECGRPVSALARTLLRYPGEPEAPAPGGDPPAPQQ